MLIAGALITIAAALLLDPGHGGHHPQPAHRAHPAVMHAAPAASRPTTSPALTPASGATRPRIVSIGAQDPQDRSASVAGRRAARALAAHCALQHVPYHHGRLAVELTAAHNGRAVLTVTAPTLNRARAGWRRFLARYHDPGRAYLPRFRALRRGGINAA